MKRSVISRMFQPPGGDVSPLIAVTRPAALLMLAMLLNVASHQLPFLTAHFLLRQDVILLAAAVVICGIAYLMSKPAAFPYAVSALQVMWLAAALAAAGIAGHWLLLHAHDMSRDEQMASFDAAVFASGHLVAPLRGLWQDHADVLNTLFMYPAEPRAAWISSYLPVNAALRAAVSLIATPALVNPILAAVGLLALWRCVERLWPGDLEALTVAVILYCCSGQILVTSMTSYAMTGHLAFNLVWLALLLRNDRWSDAGVITLGFLATGLHQPLPHPLFALPLLIWACWKNWRRGLFFFAGYGLITLFWTWWPDRIWALVQAAPDTPRPVGIDYVSRLMQTLASRGPGSIVMVANLLRFFAWQHVLLLPLLIAAAYRVPKRGLPLALAMGALLTVAVMFVILPYQGHGFGYRYLHGLIGSLILLAVYGWRQLGHTTPKWRGLLRGTTLGMLVLLLPLQAWLASAFYRPYADARARLLTIDADYVVVSGADVPFGFDLVFNPPGLDTRPIMLARELITPAFRAEFCASRPSVAVTAADILTPIAAYYRVWLASGIAQSNAATAASLAAAGCEVTGPR